MLLSAIGYAKNNLRRFSDNTKLLLLNYFRNVDMNLKNVKYYNFKVLKLIGVNMYEYI